MTRASRNTPARLFPADPHHFRTTGNGFDDYLGASSGRYFGDGYRRVDHQLAQLEILTREDGHLAVAGIGTAQYPRNWSTHADGSVRVPHLSTIDAVVLAVRLAETYLSNVEKLSDVQLAAAWLADIEIRAGATPFIELGSIPVHCFRISREGSGAGITSIFRTRIGGVSVSMNICHLAATARVGQAKSLEGPVAVPIGSGALTDLYKDTSHSSSLNFEPTSDHEAITSRHVIHPYGGAESAGIEGRYWPGVTVIDCLVIASQMAQVLIFAASDVSRSTASNLWMRRARFSAIRTPHGGGVSSSVLRIVKSRTFDRGSEGILHSVEVECPDLFGIIASASLAYTAPRQGSKTGAGPDAKRCS
ncbi:AvrD family protein [Cryobacterium sp. N21]|uniref:AvrD family protein n=1 Tax=Cryobacterium sp. N21 TaxID=2048289 RepID=UPI000CE528D6|nr:AvrD family protein [Cryobacterium sp. N21]